jgi:hypothetical protein
MPEPTAPNLEAWQARLKEELATLPTDQPITVLCHSLGCINWMHYAATLTAPATPFADRVLLVAPPYVIPEIPPSDAPPGVPGFFPPPLSPEGITFASNETCVIATDSDDYATFEQSKAYTDRLQIPIYLLEKAGHISPYWGYGEWQWVIDWCLRRADLPPQPKATE